ncbi:molybdate ABC transporter permease [Antarctobacter heliothermus]|uniref:Molybdate ABC transporter permease n=1 Tax=Antarctobacter heliothermus TaxID=74033 RepID=A0A222E365_9RHOB|nr:ABC transporter permease [Antarctobacter heliothermus]ASP20411.1 molybdate ABC transporter permease [Antarctobacter heliothermus]
MERLRGGAGFAFTLCLAWLLIAFLILPLLVVIPISFTPERYLSMPEGEYSWRHYETLFTDRRWRKGIFDSTVVALGASCLAIILGTICAIGCWKLSSRLGETIRVLALTPMIVPPIVHALGMYRVWVDYGLIDSYLGLILAHAMKGIPFVVISVSAVMSNFDPRLEQAARSLGAGPLTAMRLTILPNIWPGVLAGGVFAFAISWDEIVVALFLTRRAVYTLPRQIWDGIQDNISPAVAAVGVLLIFVTILAVLGKMAWDRRMATRESRRA